MSKGFIIGLVVCVLALVGVFVATNKDSAPEVVGTVSNHTQGAGNKGVEFMEYGDFQCPACYSFFAPLQQVKQKYGDDVKFVFRNFPLMSIHNKAQAAHRAAEAASLQGKFWEMHDQLYTNQPSWSAESVSIATAEKLFEDYAKQLGLDITRYQTDVKSEQVNATIQADIKAGQEIRANSTPTFVINGKKVETNPQATVEAISKLIDDAIAEQVGSQQ